MRKKTIQQQRIEIAKDVIKHVKAKRITAECREYFRPVAKNKNALYKGQQLQDVLPKLKECHVCVLGGIFYSWVLRHNEFLISKGGINEVRGDSFKMREIITVFTDAQLELIECAFESADIGCHCYETGVYSHSTILRAEDYRDRHNIAWSVKGAKEDSILLLHIMNNIIRNNGTFKP